MAKMIRRGKNCFLNCDRRVVNRFTFMYDTFLPARLHFAVSRRKYRSLSRRFPFVISF